MLPQTHALDAPTPGTNPVTTGVNTKFEELSNEQQQFILEALGGNNILVEACIGSGKTKSIQALCEIITGTYQAAKLTPPQILYLTYNKLLKLDAIAKIHTPWTLPTTLATNYHGFASYYLKLAGINVGISEMIKTLVECQVPVPKFDILIVDEYQDIELDFAQMLEYIKAQNPGMQIIFVGDMAQKIYDKTTLDVVSWTQKFMNDSPHKTLDLEFTRCFRLNFDHAAMLGRIWGKQIIGVNNECQISTMKVPEVRKYLAGIDPKDVLCLGKRDGAMSETLNWLEKNYPEKYNKQTIYASIKDRDANLNPGPHTGIFTTFDSAKGMERKICVVFDWDTQYWWVRTKQSDSDYEILRNIFCVAASRGKSEIIFVDANKDKLNEKILSRKTKRNEIDQVFISEMFEFKFTEEIDLCMNYLDIKEIEHEFGHDIIDIPNIDGFIDLSPCIGIYQEAAFFNNYDMKAALDDAAKRRHTVLDDLSKLSISEQILELTALNTHQNRYRHQVRLPFVTADQHQQLITRLAEQLDKDDPVQLGCGIELEDSKGSITAAGVIDTLHDNIIWELKFVNELTREHFLQLAMCVIAKTDRSRGKKHTGINKAGRLWNTRDNRIFEVSVKTDRKQDFLKQVLRTIRKES